MRKLCHALLLYISICFSVALFAFLPTQTDNVNSSNDDWRFYYIKNLVNIQIQKATIFDYSIYVQEYNSKKYAFSERRKQERLQTIYYSRNWTAQNGSHAFYSGNCTAYVASKVVVPWGGNAGAWLNNSKQLGYEQTENPQIGDIMVTNESSWGHVVYIEEVFDDGTVLVSEGNYKGLGIESGRVIDLTSVKVKGIIDMNA